MSKKYKKHGYAERCLVLFVGVAGVDAAAPGAGAPGKGRGVAGAGTCRPQVALQAVGMIVGRALLVHPAGIHHGASAPLVLPASGQRIAVLVFGIACGVGAVLGIVFAQVVPGQGQQLPGCNAPVAVDFQPLAVQVMGAGQVYAVGYQLHTQLALQAPACHGEGGAGAQRHLLAAVAGHMVRQGGKDVARGLPVVTLLVPVPAPAQ